jgi:hypothetical protein
MNQGMKLMSDPRVMKVMQDERVVKALMAAMSVPGKAQTFAKQQAENVAKAMAFATEDEVKDLRRTVRKLEDEVARLKKSNDHGTTGAAARAPVSKKKNNAAS